MKFALSFLKEILPTKLDSAEISRILTLLGLEVEKIEKKEGDEIFEVSLTPNLIHASSILGIARELSAATGEKIELPTYELKETSDVMASDLVKVEVEEKDLCPHYMARVILDVKVGPSPDWLRKKVESCGIRSINNVVDVTNLVLLEFGHPLHAFDLDKLQGQKIVVRKAKKGEKIVTLDSKERFLTESILLICDQNSPQAIAGVMGALSSEVTESTKRICLESAWFDPQVVRQAGKQLDIHTEASHRFERGTDFGALAIALDRAAFLLQKVCGGTVAKGIVSVKSKEEKEKVVSVRLKRINGILGTQLALGEVETILKSLQAKIKKIEGETLFVGIPSYRVDINHEIDLVEEVARLYGYDNIFEKKGPTYYQTSKIPNNFYFLFERKIRTSLLKEGLQELLTCDLITEKEAALVANDSSKRRSLIKLLNPANDQSVLRPTLLPNMLHVVKYNIDHEKSSLSGFEVGRIHFKIKEGYHEPLSACIVMTGDRSPYHFENKSTPVDFFDLKGVLENVFESLSIEKVTFEKVENENFHPGQTARIMSAEMELGVMGQIHPELLKKCNIEQKVFFAELNVEELAKVVKSDAKMAPLALYPATTRDWTVSIKDDVQIGQIFDKVQKLESKFLESLCLLDIYKNEKLGSETKNVTFRFVYRSLDRTISFAECEEEHKRITQHLLTIVEV